jgi:hypothetical protein
MVRFIYSGEIYDKERERIASNLAKCVSLVIPLPDEIEIEFRKLSDSVYGEMILDPRFPNRVRLSESLNTREIIRPLVHELIHLHQVFTGELSVKRDGSYVWKGRTYRVKTEGMSVEEWAALPWEQDVANTQNSITLRAMNLGIALSC